ncbi:uncharacterized protein LOC135822748 [Sycon ciliatum]|uniref:uncharacterized protein LOC135822748 n=1 Tax=Sycon ciliatum TaxID=27933 RepID=UPI0031F66CA3
MADGPVLSGYLTKNSKKVRYAVVKGRTEQHSERLEFYTDKMHYLGHNSKPNKVIKFKNMGSVGFLGMSPRKIANTTTDPDEGTCRPVTDPKARFVISLKSSGIFGPQYLELFAPNPSACRSWVEVLQEFITGKPSKERLRYDHIWHDVINMPWGLADSVAATNIVLSLAHNSTEIALICKGFRDPVFRCGVNSVKKVTLTIWSLQIDVGKMASCGEGTIYLRASPPATLRAIVESLSQVLLNNADTAEPPVKPPRLRPRTGGRTSTLPRRIRQEEPSAAGQMQPRHPRSNAHPSDNTSAHSVPAIGADDDPWGFLGLVELEEGSRILSRSQLRGGNATLPEPPPVLLRHSPGDFQNLYSTFDVEDSLV